MVFVHSLVWHEKFLNANKCIWLAESCCEIAGWFWVKSGKIQAWRCSLDDSRRNEILTHPARQGHLLNLHSTLCFLKGFSVANLHGIVLSDQEAGELMTFAWSSWDVSLGMQAESLAAQDGLQQYLPFLLPSHHTAQQLHCILIVLGCESAEQDFLV